MALPLPSAAISPRQTAHDADIVAAVTALLPGVRAIYRYGSAGSCYEREDSDIDIAILADRPIHFQERLDLSTHLMGLLERDVDVVDLRAIPVTLRVQIAAHGARLHAVSASEAAEYESRAFSDYARLNEERTAILQDVRRRGTIHG